MLASLAKPLVDPATLEVIALNYYRLSPAGFSEFLADLPATQRRQAVRATAFNVLLEMQGQGTKGEFPSAFFMGNNENDQSLVGELVNHGGGPKSSKQFTVWLEQLDETGMSSISPEVCEAFAAASGKEAKQIWTDARETFSEEEKAGLLKGIAKSDPSEACRLAAEQFRGKGPFPELLNGWLEANSMEASAWVTKDCRADMKEDANAAVADWLEAKGDVAAAKEWRSAARK
ncbi:hypothetical protein [Luteolibacter luteus]|uniref:ERAP1-like C-terminal domain-containing protein n=1 Tax=Luteolibacter luteus TaxID=2728835 RepID=A0A858RK29_9BACT|nr:hypothetical protein [Luteolibacter luteus]QJE96854.1 hypothetical protein HHL09_14025 [Luteolibacter luteus]